ncbi:MAG: ABC transporter ATP-binding protein, partial [Verrucomicrobiota bacterium]
GKGESVAVVGESGSGKSVTALTLARLLDEPPARINEGEILFKGEDILKMDANQLRRVRGGEIAYIFQEPSTALNPVFSIRNQMAEVLRLHRPEVTDLDEEMVKWLYQVGIVDPEKRLHAYPHELSGGMQQRAMIAMALCCQPDLLIADEPTTALDVTIQAQIIELLTRLRSELDMSILFITHNLGLLPGIADRVVVMYQGRIVEKGPTHRLLTEPEHPYTRGLIQCIPRLGSKQGRLTTIDYQTIENH